MTEQIQPALGMKYINIVILIDKLRKTFKTGKTKTVAWRKEQLNQLQKGISEMRIQLQAAIERDLGRSAFVTDTYSIKPCEWNITHCLSHIDEVKLICICQIVSQFMKDVVLDTPLRLAPGRTKIRYEPLGVCLIFGSWNYPYIVTLKPLCQAIAAGNCAVIKPSEMSPNTSTVMKALIENYLDKDCFAVIEGDPSVAGEITKYPWDLICFTGSTQKGKLVAEAAAKNLVPCILELGGKCPAIVDVSADVDFAASKICFARFVNAGQTCLATDYVIVHESLVQQFITRLQHHVKVMFGNDPNGSPDMGKIITDWHCDRLRKIIDNSGGEIICGGGIKRNIKYVEPTIILNPKLDSESMQEEIFGPILPIITFSDISEAINIINEKDKPLAVYYFGRSCWNANKDRVLDETSSGAFSCNEAVSHIVNHSFGFGGVGASGYGRYGGYEGFKQFSNPKSILIKPATNFWPYTQLTPPYPPSKKRIINVIIALEGTQWGVNRAILLLIFLGFLTYVCFHWSTWVYQPLQNVCKNHFN